MCYHGHVGFYNQGVSWGSTTNRMVLLFSQFKPTVPQSTLDIVGFQLLPKMMGVIWSLSITQPFTEASNCSDHCLSCFLSEPNLPESSPLSLCSPPHSCHQYHYSNAFNYTSLLMAIIWWIFRAFPFTFPLVPLSSPRSKNARGSLQY